MSLAAGTRLGPYELGGLIGAGGMGEVYEASDTRLDRTVAIKVLPAHVSADSERRARFEREARTIAGLNHPHICILHDVGEHPLGDRGPATLYLVMERLTGETLAERLRKGPLSLRKALTVAMEIADALAAAHRQGIVHRDLKPGNVMLTSSGAKLLDFGLAKLRGHGEQPVADPAKSISTRSEPLTSEGTIVGTLQYMAPEQLEGKAIDARTDLWALGAILYEMITGKEAFEGDSPASVIANVMYRDPAPPSNLQPLTPAVMDELIRRCLAKAPDKRWDSAHDLGEVLRWMRDADDAGVAKVQILHRRANRRAVVLAAAGVVLGTILGAGATWWARPPSSSPPLARPSLKVIPADELNAGGVQTIFLPTPGGSRTAIAWTPDGRSLVFVGRRGGVQQLYARALDAANARPLQGTEDAQVPAVSADGRWVAFWARGAVRKVALAGGPVMDLVTDLDEPPTGLAWDGQGRVFFGKVNGAIWAVPPGGAPTAVTTPSENEVSHGLPWPLPNDRAVLYTVRKRVWSWGDDEVVVQDLTTRARKMLVKDAADARYVAGGHLVFLRRGQLFAVPFDPEQLEVRGTPVPVLDGVAQALTAANAGDVTGAGQFAISSSGSLAWLPGALTPFRDGALVTVDRKGQVTPLPTAVRSYGRPVRVSADGRRLAVTIVELTGQGLWVYDVERSTLIPVTREGEVSCPAWSPDARRLVFGWLIGGLRTIAVQPADGTLAPEVLAPGPFCPSSVAPDGLHVIAARGIDDLVVVNAERDKVSVEPVAVVGNAARAAELSPDGGWLAYEANVSGRYEVYLRPYGRAGATEQVSIEGGQSPAWHPSGRELFFVGERGPTGTRPMMAAEFVPGSPPSIGRPRPLFEFDPRELGLACIPLRCYDVAPDGQKFYAVQQRVVAPAPPVSHVELTLDWLQELQAQVPRPR